MLMASIGPAKGNEIEPALREALGRLGSEAKLVMLFEPDAANHASLYASVRRCCGAPVIGCTTGGAGFTDRGVTESGIVGALLGGEDLEVETALLAGQERDLADAMQKTMAAFQRVKRPGNGLFMLADPLANDGEALIKAVKAAMPFSWHVFGGLAGDGWTLKGGAKVFLNGEALDHSAVFVHLNYDNSPTIGVRHGFKPIEGSREMRVTGVKGNLLVSLDDSPAAEVYREELERLGVAVKGEDMIKKMALNPLGIPSLFGERIKIRTPLGLEAGTSLALAGSVHEGDKVRIVSSTPDAMIASASELASGVRQTNGARAAVGQIVVDCAGRRSILGARYPEQVKAFRYDEKLPLVGFTSYGEFAKSAGLLEGFHNTTMVTAVL
jgi:hypothetical protein